MTTKYGMFKEYEHGVTGDRPGSKGADASGSPGGTVAYSDREKGLNFKATVGRTGKNNDATFDKFTSLHEGDKFIDPKRRALLQDQEGRKKNVTDLPFRAASPMKKSACVGDYYGTIEGKVTHEPGTLEVKKKKGEVPQVPKGIYTSPAKKGTFGYNKVTLSERVGYKGVATEYEYQHDPDGLLKARQRQQMEDDRKARVSDLPFKPSNPGKKGTFGVPNTTISKGEGIAGEWKYVMQAAPGSAGTDGGAAAGETSGSGGGAAAGESKDLTPFRPSNAHVGKRLNHIEYIHDPEGPKMKAESEKKKAESARIAASGAWRPNMSYKSDMVRSIVKMNIPRC
mmetsp:Transcript_24220/g.52925  ORF Transcript_24220/g.52925 Transcript_24220/m.52925 type:complete len:340 (+) Transcript_24220:316-1335(+)|eukprot:CAMPEP_0202900892 /NCGR_PEP_ID=MMETSP1392-20130828/12093_1 /ASSEMBLY_ACC=CAM_ASM_000868 /TAXON_ID=225041 /ORGANISM="Chlamydomonas chlamydogama, Strain SAG 11-48b" /LENGTH=339 /DNA_ID=CAMNT_0049587349 /DNA_START=315 /DNA_END=1334 /DNA_ORIENTATION=+